MVTEIAPNYPKRIVIEPTNLCNLRCRMCGQSWRKFRGSYLDFETVKKIEPALPLIKEAVLFGWGEPLIYPKFRQLFELVSSYPIGTYFTTNGTRLSDETAAMLVERELDYLGISFDGASEETYNGIRRYSDFNKVLAGVKRVIEYKNKLDKHKPYTRFTMVLMKKNLLELPSLIKLASEIGLDEVRALYLVAYSKEMIEQSLFFDKEMIPSVFEEAAETAEKLGIKLRLPPIIGQPISFNGRSAGYKNCPRPFDDMFVQADSKVRPCVISSDIMGDFKNQTFEEIWNGSKYVAFRKKIKSNNPPASCKACHQCNFLNINDIRAHVAIDYTISETN